MIELMRSALQPHYRNADDAHPGLLLQRGYPRHDSDDSGAKTDHIDRICNTGVSDYYHHAYRRWQRHSADPLRFHQLELALESRLYIGLSGSGMLETGCSISHSYGLPYLPGSSIKGAVRGRVGRSAFAEQHPAACSELFGSDAGDEHPAGLSGLVAFHDAWWVPGSADTPMVREVVTSHHQDYYGSEGSSNASDLDSPVPNAQVAVRGSFLLVLEGDPGWTALAAQMTLTTLTTAGVGAKTRSGYGLFQPRDPAADLPQSDWLDGKLQELMTKHHAHGKEDETLRGKPLANAWKDLPDGSEKDQALQAIKARWAANGWWDTPPGRASKQAKGIYGASDNE